MVVFLTDVIVCIHSNHLHLSSGKVRDCMELCLHCSMPCQEHVCIALSLHREVTMFE
jgi:hypothetical protein